MGRHIAVDTVLRVIFVFCLLAPLSNQRLWADPLFYTGYFAHKNGAEVSFSRTPTANTVSSLRHQYDLNGIWLETLVPVTGCSPLGFALGGALLFPLDQRSDETVYAQGQGVAERTWLANSQWWYLQTLVSYELFSGVSGVVGFRYDNFQTNFTDPSREVFGGGGAIDRVDLTINSYIPYFGLALSSVSPGAGVSTEIGVVGFPTLLGSVDFREAGRFHVLGVAVPGFSASDGFDAGYFLEGYANAIVHATSWCQLGAFVRLSTINAKTGIDIGERNATIPNAMYDFDFTRKSWIVGALASLSF